MYTSELNTTYNGDFVYAPENLRTAFVALRSFLSPNLICMPQEMPSMAPGIPLSPQFRYPATSV